MLLFVNGNLGFAFLEEGAVDNISVSVSLQSLDVTLSTNTPTQKTRSNFVLPSQTVEVLNIAPTAKGGALAQLSSKQLLVNQFPFTISTDNNVSVGLTRPSLIASIKKPTVKLNVRFNQLQGIVEITPRAQSVKTLITASLNQSSLSITQASVSVSIVGKVNTNPLFASFTQYKNKINNRFSINSLETTVASNTPIQSTRSRLILSQLSVNLTSSSVSQKANSGSTLNKLDISVSNNLLIGKTNSVSTLSSQNIVFSLTGIQSSAVRKAVVTLNNNRLFLERLELSAKTNSLTLINGQTGTILPFGQSLKSFLNINLATSNLVENTYSPSISGASKFEVQSKNLALGQPSLVGTGASKTSLNIPIASINQYTFTVTGGAKSSLSTILPSFTNSIQVRINSNLTLEALLKIIEQKELTLKTGSSYVNQILDISVLPLNLQAKVSSLAEAGILEAYLSPKEASVWTNSEKVELSNISITLVENLLGVRGSSILKKLDLYSKVEVSIDRASPVNIIFDSYSVLLPTNRLDMNSTVSTKITLESNVSKTTTIDSEVSTKISKESHVTKVFERASEVKV